ncbi:MAG TPA: hypothetical protein PKI92_03515 [Candidatus Woesebacteria bacterium]|nr:hypothetical protein [Candidatus Woesebacteria bacterium]
MKYIVTFAGPPGSSKTPIANYLSEKFNLPIFNHDSIRTEVTEDLLKFDEEEFRKRSFIRLSSLFEQGDSFILDVSIDREWKNYQDKAQNSHYKIFTISLDLSRNYLIKLYKAKRYLESLKNIDKFILDHQKYLSEYSSMVNLSIKDNNFKKRLTLSEQTLTSWLKNNGS